MRNRAFVIGVVLVVIATLLAAADYFLKERPEQILLEQQNAPEQPQTPTIPQQTATGAALPQSSAASSVSSLSSSPEAMTSSMSSSSHVVKKGVSTKKKSGVDVHFVLQSLGLTPEKTSEASLLQLTTRSATVETVVLLLNNDRAALFAWVESDDVKSIFSGLKQALQEQFSPKLTDLVDETRTQDAGPPYDLLSFTDPAISPEKVMFIRVRNRLYEFHIAANGQSVIDALVSALSM